MNMSAILQEQSLLSFTFVSFMYHVDVSRSASATPGWPIHAPQHSLGTDCSSFFKNVHIITSKFPQEEQHLFRAGFWSNIC
jgi:hypothetical protein